MILLILSFVAGLLTVLAPCVLPMLPIILLGSIEEKGLKRPLIIIFSLCISIIVFTLLLKVSTIFLGVPNYVWKYLSGGIIIFLWIIYIFPHIWHTLWAKMNISKSQNLLQNSQNIKSKNLGAIATGASLWPVFSSCSPTYAFIIATVFPLSFGEGILYTSVYALWVGSLFFLVALFWQKIIKRLRNIADEKWTFHKIIGIIFIIVWLGIISWLDKKVETKILDTVNISYIEQKLFDTLNPKKINTPQWKKETKQMNFKKAPDIKSNDWVQWNPVSIDEVKGKVVLVNFWTLGCINCKNTLPKVVDWDNRYREKWLIVIWVHTPEFAYEKKKENIENTIAEYGIKYRVAMDNDFKIWKEYENQYWPAFYFIDKKWNIRKSYFWEGNYENNEKFIQSLLEEF
jgi:cytochrome c biogenesis protein CcdA/thiol-disulfide isomerase/thioredoxin